MDKRNVTQRLAEYMYNNRISVSQVASDTRIDEDKLVAAAEKTLNTTEFLTLCNYLNVKPEEI